MLLRDYADDIRFIARKEGYEEGFREGYEEGFREGYEEGYEEVLNGVIIKFFTYLVNKGMDTEKAMIEVSEVLQLSVQEVEAIVRKASDQ